VLEYRIASVADAEARRVSAVRQDREVQDVPGGGPSEAPQSASIARLPVYGPGLYAILDLPALREGDAPAAPVLAAWADPWPPATAVYRSATTDGWQLAATTARRARVGTLVADLPAGPVARFDLASAAEVQLKDGTLTSVGDLDLFAGANAFAVESAPGLWEVFQAAEATLIGPGRYRLTRLLRGQRGTEAAIGDPAPEGARVVVLDGNVTRLPVGEAGIGLPVNWRIGPSGKDPAGDAFVTVPHTASGVGLRPFAPVQVAQPGRRGRVPGDLTISWIRRSRDLAADSWMLAEVPLGEAAEAYEVDILDGGTVLRTLSAGAPSAVYTQADQVADFGAALGPGDTLDLRIAQVSSLLGRGAAAAVTLEF